MVWHGVAKTMAVVEISYTAVFLTRSIRGNVFVDREECSGYVLERVYGANP